MYHPVNPLLDYKDLLHSFAELDLHSGAGSSMSNPELTLRLCRQHAPLCMWVKTACREWVQTRVVTLEPSQQIVAHKDWVEPGILRFHIPLQTQDGCWSYSIGEWQALEEGMIYRMDPRALHGAVNWSPLPRYHLMIDVR